MPKDIGILSHSDEDVEYTAIYRLAIAKASQLLHTHIGQNWQAPKWIKINPDLWNFGKVHISIRDGIINWVLPPEVNTDIHKDSVLHLVTHELSHYHELLTRQQQSKFFLSNQTTVFWSEYYAERMCHRVGAISNNPTKFDVFKSPQDWSSGIGLSYAVAWAIAEYDETGIWHESLTEDQIRFLEMAQAHIPTIDKAFRTFPKWHRRDLVKLDVGIRQLIAFERSRNAHHNSSSKASI